MATTYGNNMHITIYGGSHDDHIGVIAEGLPQGFAFDREELLSFLARRAPGRNALSTPRKEADLPEFLSGVDNDVLTGENLHAIIRNTSQRSSDYSNLSFVPRPSHADFAARCKYGDAVDLRGGGHFSGRLTAPLCIVGGICLQYLRAHGIRIAAHVSAIGNVTDTPFDAVTVGDKEFSLLASRSEFPVLDEQKGDEMRKVIEDAREHGDSIGGIIECAAIGLPAGLGEHMFDGVENRIASIMFGIPAIKGIEFGVGFDGVSMRGSEYNDAFITDGTRITTRTNHVGGILGGMTNGMPCVFRVVMKPTPSIFHEQDSVDMITMTPTKLTIKGRHDPCVVLRAVPVVEAAAAIALCDLLLDEPQK